MRISDWSSDVCSSDLLVPACAAQFTWPNRREGEEAQCKAGDRASIVFLGRNDHLPQGDKVGDGGLAAFAEGLQNGARFLRRIALHDPLGDAIDEYGGNALAYALRGLNRPTGFDFSKYSQY